MSVRVIVGLGNPGARYDRTRHNVGFRVLDALAQVAGGSWREERRFCAHTATVTFAGASLVLAKPLTFMNESGRTVGELCRFLKLKPAEVCVVFDEIQTPVGGLKVSIGGGSGGHNGVRSIIDRIGGEFVRYRIGIAPLSGKREPEVLADFVLSPFAEGEQQRFEENLGRYVAGLRQIVAEGPILAMNTLNQRSPSSTQNL